MSPVDSGNVIAGRRVQLLSVDDVVDIAHGGTGATDIQTARDNLQVFGVNDDPISFAGDVEASGAASFADQVGITKVTQNAALLLVDAGGVNYVKLTPESAPGAAYVLSLMLQTGTLIPRVASVDLTAQTTSIGSTILLTAPAAGMYEVKIVQEDTAASAAGTLTTTIGWTGRGGAQTFTTSATVLTGLGGIPVPPLLIYIASGNLTYLTTVAGVIGSPQYSLGISVERLF